MREGEVGGGDPALRHQRRQVSHQQRDQEHRDCCEEFTVKLTPRFEVSVVVYCKIIADYNESMLRYGELALATTNGVSPVTYVS